MTFTRHATTYAIGKPSVVWGAPDEPDTYVRAVVPTVQRYAVLTNVVYNSALRCFTLAPIRSAPAMDTDDWTVGAGTFVEFAPPDRQGTYLRQKDTGDWGLTSDATVPGTASFSIYVKRGANKNWSAAEYLTIGLNETGVTERKFKFWRDGRLDVLDSGTVVQSLTLADNDRQRWGEADELVLDFYTLSTEGTGRLLIASPLLSEPLVVDRGTVNAAKVVFNGSGPALIGFYEYAFATSGSIVLNSMPTRTDGAARVDDPDLRTFPAPPGGCGVVLSSVAWVGGKFKPTIAVTGDGANPVAIQVMEFGWRTDWTMPDEDGWQDVTQYVRSAKERVDEEMTGREISIGFGFDEAGAAAFRTLYAACLDNPAASEVAFRYVIPDPDPEELDALVERHGVLRLADESRAENGDHTLSATAKSRIAALGAGDATTLPMPQGLTGDVFWDYSLRTLGFHPDYNDTGQAIAYEDPGWGYDRLEAGAGKTVVDYLRELATQRAQVIDERQGALVTIRDRTPTPYDTINVVTATPDPDERVSSIARSVEADGYANAVEVIYEDAQGIPCIARAYAPALIAADRRVVAQVESRNDRTLSPTAEAEALLRRRLEVTERLSVDIPPYGLVQMWPGVTRLAVATANQYATVSPNGKVYIVAEADFDLEWGDSGFVRVAVVARNAAALTGVSISTEDGLYASGAARSENSAAADTSPWAMKRKETKQRKGVVRPGDRARYGR